MKFKKREWLFLVVSFLCTITQAWAELKIPEYMAQITTHVQTPDTELSVIFDCGLGMLGFAGIALVSAIIVIYCSSVVSAAIGREFRSVMFKKVISFNNQEVEKFSISSLLTRTVKDVETLQMMVVMTLQTVIKAPILFFWSLGKISDMPKEWTHIMIYIIIGLVTILGALMLIAAPRFNKIQKAYDDISRITRETLNGIRVVRAYNGEEYQTKKFEDLNSYIYKQVLFTDRLLSAMMPLLTAVMSSISLIVYCSGAYIIAEAAATEKLPIFSNMMVFSSYAIQVIASFLMMGTLLFMLPRGIVVIKRVVEVLKTKPTIVDGENSLNETVETIVFRNVNFAYPNDEKETLHNIHFHINKGETVALIGATGCGKSSIVNLLLRLYDVSSGQILVNGKNIKDYKVSDIRNKIGYISQKAILFSGDIADNVTYGQVYSAEKMKDILSIAQAASFVNELPEKEFANVAQNGTNYSGGQKQRLSIARALYKNPEILIFDDSFSALDFRTDLNLRKELSEKLNDVTKIIVAQRIGTIKNADRIIVLDHGRIAGTGTHDELLAENTIYQKIVESQLQEVVL